MKQKTQSFMPLFHDKNILTHFYDKTLPLDDQGLYRPLEMMLFPGEITEKLDHEGDQVIKVKLENGESFYTFSELALIHQNVQKYPLTENNIMENLLKFNGSPYVWGSNWMLSKDEMRQLEEHLVHHPSSFAGNLKTIFSGVDCSGLLYAACLGQVPRNTSQLVHFGEFVDIDNCSNEQICNKIRPLDLLVWKGHVLIFLDENTLIESRKDFGCVIVDSKNRLDEIRQTRKPSSCLSEQSFFIKRWQ